MFIRKSSDLRIFLDILDTFRNSRSSSSRFVEMLRSITIPLSTILLTLGLAGVFAIISEADDKSFRISSSLDVEYMNNQVV